MLRKTQGMVSNGNPAMSQWIVVWQNMKFSNGDKGLIDGEVTKDGQSLMFTTLSGHNSIPSYCLLLLLLRIVIVLLNMCTN